MPMARLNVVSILIVVVYISVSAAVIERLQLM